MPTADDPPPAPKPGDRRWYEADFLELFARSPAPKPGDRYWDEAAFLERFARLQVEARSGGVLPSSVFHQAAAVLGAYDPNALLGPDGEVPTEDDLAPLLADSVPVSAPKKEQFRFALKPAPRVAALRSVPDRETLVRAADRNPGPGADPVHRYLTGFIRGTIPPDAPIPDEDALAAAEAAGWLLGVPVGNPLPVPNPDDLRRRAGFLRFLAPLNGAVVNFQGRTAELARLAEHAVANRLRLPLVVSGVGGVGKSALLARSVLAHLGRGPNRDSARGPAVVLDMDRPSLRADAPATLLLEAARQLDLQASSGVGFGTLSLSINDYLQQSTPTGDSEDVGRLLGGSFGVSWLGAFANSYQRAWAGRPLLLVVDTFEEVQYRSARVVEQVWNFLAQLREAVPETRAVVVGRTVVRSLPQEQPIALVGLDGPDAIAFLEGQQVPVGVADKVYDVAGGNPLTLRLAAALYHRDPVGTDAFLAVAFAEKLLAERADAVLVERILNHVHDERVRKLAHPGLILRRITADLIRDVLSGPCQVVLSGPDEAQRLLDELAKETALVVVEADGIVLRHRPDIRVEMIDLLRVSDPDTVRAIHDAAVQFYSRRPGFESFESIIAAADRAEELYHRLCRGDSQEELDARWSDDADEYLRSSVDELPDAAKAYLAGKAGAGSGGFEAISLSDDFWSNAEGVSWERKAARWVGDLIRQDRFPEALSALRSRPDRSRTSPLFILEARVLKALGRWGESRELLHRAMEQWPSSSEDELGLVELHLLLVRVAERQKNPTEAVFAVNEAVFALNVVRESLARASDPRLGTLALDISAAIARLARKTFFAATANENLIRQLADTPDRVFLASPDVARRAAAATVAIDPSAAARVVALVGLGVTDQEALAGLARMLDLGRFAPPLAWASWEEWAQGSRSDVGPELAAVLRASAANSIRPTPFYEALAEILTDPEEIAERQAANTKAAIQIVATGEMIRDLTDLIVGTFNAHEFLFLCRSRFDLAIEFFSNEDFRSSVFRTVDSFEKSGRVPELIRAIAEQRPDRADIQQFANRWSSEVLVPTALRLSAQQQEKLSAILEPLFGTKDGLRAWRKDNFGEAMPNYSGRSPYLQEQQDIDGADSVREAILNVTGRMNGEGNAGQFLAVARRTFPTASELYRFAEDFGLAAATADQDRAMRDRIADLDIDLWRSRLGAVERQVCTIITPEGSGTGFLVAPNVVMTSSRVVRGLFNSSYGAEQVTVRFDGQRLSDGTIVHAGEQMKLATTDWHVITERRSAPVSALRLADEPQGLGGPRGVVEFASGQQPDLWFVLHHDPPRPLALSDLRTESEVAVVMTADGFIRYPTTLGPAAAGAPVFDREWRLVAVHHGPTSDSPHVHEATPVERFRQALVAAQVTVTHPHSNWRITMPEDPKLAPLPDDQTLAATEARLKQVLAPKRGGLESMEAVPDVEPPKSAKERARERLRANPKHAVAGRLRRKGIAPAPLESGLESMGSAESMFPESAELSEADIALGLERIIGRNELLGVQYLDGGLAASRSVGRILVRRGSRVVAMGTGFLVSPRLLMTNNHVLPTPQSAQGGLVQFNYQFGLDGRPLPAASFDLQPDAFYLTSKSTELDFTLVAVRETADTGAPLADFGFKRLSDLSDEILAGESVTIIQHPGGEPKQIALRENFVLALPQTADRYLYYQTDTTPGSSGSPVFNDDWEVVALHHSGYAKRDEQNRILARDGRVWTENMGEDQVDWIANEGIRVAALVKYLSAVAGLDESKKKLLTAALTTVPAVAVAARPKPVADPPAVENREATSPARTDPSPPAPVVAGSGGTEWTLSLPITVRLGAPQLGPLVAAPGAGGLERIEIDTDYSDREGYDPAFLGGGTRRVPLPTMTAAMIRNAAGNQEAAEGAPKFELPYHHYSVVLNAKRRLAFFTAVNIDGTLEKNLGKREKDKWIFDHRVESRLQIGNEWYAKPFDRGHLVRRLDPAWGRATAVAKSANDDTFHFTNCSPQHSRFNQGKNLWQGLENYLLDTANKEDRRISVFTGPIFETDDPVYEGVQIPKQFWKVAAFVRPDGTMGAAGFIVNQEELLAAMGLEATAEQVARTFQVHVSKIEERTGLDFGRLRDGDKFPSTAAPLEGAQPAELEEFEQIRL